MGEVVEAEQIEQGFARTAKDLFAGAVGGVAQVLLGKLYKRVEAW